ncbi:MAG: hypothetical protein E7041_04005 [Lentisphaerae bacterium]|nr:hypothetical protein [Lentisphaerota bacterium]
MKVFTSPLDGGFWINDFKISSGTRDIRTQMLRIFELDTVPGACEIQVTADARYTLWVNGQFVNHGPARGFVESQPFDRLEIAPYLVKGQNHLALLQYRPGGSNYSYVFSGIHGVLLHGIAGNTDISSGPQWLLRNAPGYIPGVAKAAGQYAYQEYFDCTAGNWEWIAPGFVPDDSWRHPTAEECRIPGSPPWTDFEEREVPLLTGEKRSCKLINCGSLEPSEPCGLATPLRQSLAGDVISWDGNENGAVKVYRFDGEFFGLLEFTIDAETETLIDYISFEAFQNDGKTPLISPKSDSLYGGRLKAGKGRNFHQLTMPWGGKAVMIIDRSPHPERNTVKIEVLETVYPLDVQGTFTSNDQLLNEIWKISLETQKHCMCDAYVDGPWRECAQWWGDALVQARNTFVLSDDVRLLERGIRQFAMQQAPSGLIYGVTPAQAPRCVLPDYAAIYLASCYYLYYQNGSTDIYHRVYDRLQSIVKYFDEMSEDGLLPLDMRFWMFVDWCPELDKQEAYNLIVVYCLDLMAELAALAGDEAFAAKCRRIAGRIAGAVTLHDPSPHAAAMAVLCGRFREYEEKLKNEVLLPLLHSDRDFHRMPSPYFMFFVFEAVKKLHCDGEVIDCIKRWWKSFVDAGIGTTPEKWLEKCGAGTSRCHAWSAHPMVSISEILLGIRQNEAAWRSVIFDPLTLPGLRCSGTVPTPYGVISVAIDSDKKSYSVTAPPEVRIIDIRKLL